MTKYPFHDSGIVDEGLSDETGSLEEDTNIQNKQSSSTDKNFSFECISCSILFKTMQIHSRNLINHI